MYGPYENTAYCQLWTIRGHSPDESARIPDSVRDLKGRCGSVLGPRGVQPHDVQPPDEASDTRSADNHCFEYSAPKKGRGVALLWRCINALTKRSRSKAEAVGVGNVPTQKRAREAVAVLVASDGAQSNFGFTAFSEVRQGFIGNSSLPGSLTNLLPANHYGSFIRMVPKAAVMGTPAESEGRSGGGA